MADAKAHERGQTLPLLVLVVVVAAGLIAGVVKLGTNAAQRAAAQTAADAAALAGAVDGEAAARDLARANGAELVDFDERDDGVVVTVRRGRATARARAVASRPSSADCTETPPPWHPVGRTCNKAATFRGGAGGA